MNVDRFTDRPCTDRRLTTLGQRSKLFRYPEKQKKSCGRRSASSRASSTTMASGKTRPGRSLADQLADLEDPTPKGMLSCFLLKFAFSQRLPITDMDTRF